MIQITNLSDNKTEWNMSEPRILIPMIDGSLIANKDSDKIPITPNTLENLEQTVLANKQEQNLVIGLDRNLFESNLKNELLVIQNSDFKLLSCNADLKNSVTYTLSYLEPDKNEILWENLVAKDKTKGSWCSGVEVNYDEVTKTWQDDLEKSNETLNLDEVENHLSSQDNKIERDILVPPEEMVDKPFEIANYFKPENIDEVEKNRQKNKQNNMLVNNQSHLPNKININCKLKTQKIKVEEIKKKFYKIIPSNDVKIVDKSSIVKTSQNKHVLINKVSSSLPEKSLPLKKKAKMKKTNGFANDKLRFNKIENCDLKEEKGSDSSKECKKSLYDSSSDSDEPLSNKIKNKKPISNQIQASENLVNNVSEKQESSNVDNLEDLSSKKANIRTLRNIYTFKNKKFTSIYELVDELKKCRIINTSVWQLLITGLKEMNVDILEEMKRKAECSNCNSYSPQLKGFALILYFKQPAAYNQLAKLYKNGWPSLDIIKEWKRKLNQCRRQNFSYKTDTDETQ